MAFDLKNTRSVINLQRNYKWILTIPAIDFDQKLIESVSFPTSEFSADPFHIGGGEIFLPSFKRIGTVSIEFLEDTRGSMLRMLEDWKSEIVSEDGVFGYPSGATGFKKEALLILLDGQNNEHTRIRLLNMFPLRLSTIRMSYDSSNKILVIQDFAIDDAVIE